MAVRISQRQMYSSYLSNMNNTLSAYMESNVQSATQKRVNKPSDDPYASAQIMASNRHLNSLTQYKDNLNMATGWLNQADSTLGLVHDELTKLKTLLQQAANGTLSSEQRQSIGYEARGIYNQLLAYSNTKFNGRYIFAGHKVDDTAFDAALGMTCHDANLDNVKYKISGGADYTITVQFLQSGDISTTDLDYRYSTDGGETWKEMTGGAGWNAGPPRTFAAGSATVEAFVPNTPGAPINVTAVDPDGNQDGDNGTWMYIRPTAVYNGDTNDTIVVSPYPTLASATGSASGAFGRDVVVRIDDIDPVNGKIVYSYSSDDGNNWQQANTPYDPAAPGNPCELPIPGGVLTLSNAPTLASPPEQFYVRPQRADVELNIGSNATIVINNIGSDVFGGIYEAPFATDGPQPVGTEGRNMFEVIGAAIAALETNSQTGAQVALDELNGVMEHVVSKRTTVGARGNRVTATLDQVETLTMDESDRLSGLEDADISELLTRLAQQQLAYQSVLKSSSMIMQMSLMNFL